MDEDIFKDMIDYGDDETDTDVEDFVAEEEDITENEVTDTEEYPTEYTEDMDTDGDYEEEIPQQEDERLIEPMIKPILKWLIPLLLVLALVIFFMTSELSAVKTYRENFIANISRIMYNMGIEPGSEPEEKIEEKTEQENTVEYKEVKATQSNDRVAQYRTDVANDVMITFDGASNSEFAKYRDGVLCTKTNYLCYINKDGEKEWEKNISITDPILKVEGDYYVIAQNGGIRFALCSGQDEVYELNAENNILSANVSANGDVVLITEKAGYKGAIYVYNKRGDNAFAWSSGSSSIISADISAKSRRVAAALLNTDSTVKSGVYLFNIKKPDSYAQRVFDDSIIYNVDFKDDNLNIFADNAMLGMRKSGNISYHIDFGTTELASSAIDDNGDKLLLFTGTSIPVMNIYNNRGKLKNTVSSRKLPDFAYVHDGNVIYNVDREIFLSKLNARIPYKYTAAMDIQGLIPIDEKSFMVIYSNSVSVITMKGVLW